MSYAEDVKRISVFLSEPQVKRFKALAKELGRPYAELIRDALDEYLRQRGSTTKKAERPRAGTRENFRERLVLRREAVDPRAEPRHVRLGGEQFFDLRREAAHERRLRAQKAKKAEIEQ